jgi:predicted transcriptional regulator
MKIKKLKNEAELVREALRVGALYAEKRGVGEFEDTDSAHDKVTFLYRLLVHDKLIQPLATDQVSDPNMKHKLALWISRQLPSGHPLLK